MIELDITAVPPTLLPILSHVHREYLQTYPASFAGYLVRTHVYHLQFTTESKLNVGQGSEAVSTHLRTSFRKEMKTHPSHSALLMPFNTPEREPTKERRPRTRGNFRCRTHPGNVRSQDRRPDTSPNPPRPRHWFCALSCQSGQGVRATTNTLGSR